MKKHILLSAVSAVVIMAASSAFAAGNGSTVLQTGSKQEAAVTQSGGDNKLYVKQSGANNITTGIQNGYRNTANITQELNSLGASSGHSGSVLYTVDGSDTKVNIKQTGLGTNKTAG